MSINLSITENGSFKFVRTRIKFLQLIVTKKFAKENSYPQMMSNFA